MQPTSKNEKTLRMEDFVKLKIMYVATCIMLFASLMYGATPAKQIPAGKKAKITGKIVSRNGDMVNVTDKKDGQTVIINLTDNTKVEREKGALRLRRADMDVTAMLPGLTITAEGVGNAKGQLDASKVWFNPDAFSIEVAQEQQIEANQAAAAHAQSTADSGVQQAQAAQGSANMAQSTANQAGNAAVAAGALGVMDADAITMVNKRVSDLGDYNTVAEAGIYFPTGNATLDAAAKADLDKLAQMVTTVNNYMIEVAGYASSTGTKEVNQKLSDERATAVVLYLRNQKSVPMRRILAPAGYGATHPAAANTDSEGRAQNQRVDVKVLVNKGLDQGM
jgi:outer membrane protein OmpA-like peptidoglycan-associated protein